MTTTATTLVEAGYSVSHLALQASEHQPHSVRTEPLEGKLLSRDSPPLSPSVSQLRPKPSGQAATAKVADIIAAIAESLRLRWDATSQNWHSVHAGCGNDFDAAFLVHWSLLLGLLLPGKGANFSCLLPPCPFGVVLPPVRSCCCSTDCSVSR